VYRFIQVAFNHFAINTNSTRGQELKQFAREQIKKGFRLSTDSDINLYTEYLLMQPVRSVLQVLSRIQEDENAAGNSHFSLAIQDLALQNFYHYNIAAEELAAEDFRAMVEAVFDVAMHDGDPDTSAYLRPGSALPHNRGAMYGLSAAVAQQLHGKPSACIAYLLRGPGMVKLAHDASVSNKRGLTADDLGKAFRRYMGVGKNDDALGWARLATVALVSEHAIAQNQRVVRYGIVGLNQDSSSGLIGYRKVFESFAQENKAYPAAAFSLVNSSGTGSRTFASIYNVLGLMGRLLTLLDIRDWNTLSEEKKKEKVLNRLSGFYPNTNSISVPPWIAVTTTDNEEDSSEKVIKEEEESEASHQAWGDLLVGWLNGAKQLAPHIAPSSVFMGKVWPRLFFGLENISDALRPWRINQSDRKFSTLMELFALCVVNAFLTEESTYHLTGETEDDLKPITMANPRSSASDYLKRLSKLGQELSVERLPLTYIVATCPLITGLIAKEKNRKDIAWPFSIRLVDHSTYTPGNFIKPEDWKALESIAIQGKKPPKTKSNSIKNGSDKTSGGDTA
jgi:hypothetical protein